MSIVPLMRFTLIGREADRDSLLESLQSLACTHIQGMEPSGREGGDPQQALDVLMNRPIKRHQDSDGPDFGADELIRRVLHSRDRLHALSERLEFVKHRIHNVEPWGDFELPTVASLEGNRFWFYQIPRYKLEAVRQSSLNWSVVNRDERFAYVVVIAEEEPDPRLLPVPRTHMGNKPLSSLQRSQEELKIELDECRVELYNYTQWIVWLAKHMSETLDARERQRASELCQQHHGFFAVDGWVPAVSAEALQKFAESQGCAVHLEPVAEQATAPTLLSNPPKLSGGEDLVAFYQMPGYRSWDPSRVLFFSFALFFAMIMADAGYALLLAIGLGLLWHRLGRGAMGRRMRSLMAAILGTSFIYGVLCGSYFGVLPDSLQSLQIIRVTDYEQMIQIAVAVGCLHVLLANGITVWHWWGAPRAYLHLGWMMIIVAASSWWFRDLLTPQQMMASPELALAMSGVVLVIWNGNPQAVTSWKSVLARIATGLVELANLSKVFGDVLSYLRLFALGLASASLAVTFNQLAQDIQQQLPNLGLLVAMVVLVIGHALNLVLAVVSGVVHGLRLNFIEFYHWSLSEEGYPFRPFKKQEIETWKP